MKISRLFFLGALMFSILGPVHGQYAQDKANSGDSTEKVIPGMTIEREGGKGLLGLEIKNSTFVLSFYDKDKELMKADRKQAVMRWRVNYKRGDERTILNLDSTGSVMTSAFVVKPPHLFMLFITLLENNDGSPEKSVETYTVNFSG